MNMPYKPKVYFTSTVFSSEEIGSNELISATIRLKIKNLWEELKDISVLKVFDGRFPTEDQIRRDVDEFNPDILGCHLSHQISSNILGRSNLFAISTATAGFNHIQRTDKDDILITHTPGVLHETVADYTISIIMANLRNLIDLHYYVWNDQWTTVDKWDLDKSLSSLVTNKVLGIVGMGEIGKELVKKLAPWDIKILYYDIRQMKEFEKKYPMIEFREKIEDIFGESDIVSLHVPLNKHTEKLVSRDLLMLMKRDALLVNTARGDVLDLDTLLYMLENKEIQINIAFDVFPVEPIEAETLERLKRIKEAQPLIRMILMPHNASADANTRGMMNVLFLTNIINIIKSSSLEDLREINIIPEHKKQLTNRKWRISDYWDKN
jgi:glyoxylate reductase